MMLTCRPEFQFQPSWHHRSYLMQVTLNRLSRSQIEHMVKRVAGGKNLPTKVLQQIVERTDGVPLFVEEMTKAVLESGTLKEVNGQYELVGSLSSLAIPATLQDSLMARLDRLVTAKAVAQYASVIGRQFSCELLQAVSQVDASTLQRELGRLVEAELVYQRGLPPQATYTFKHALIQDAAYHSLLKSTRQQYHQRITHTLEAQFPEMVETQPELLAYHYTEAGLNERAIGYWHRAGQRAIERSANVEAVSHLTKGLELLQTLADTVERTQYELTLLMALGPALMATKGWAAPEVEHAYTRARELCQQVGDTPQLFVVLKSLFYLYYIRAEYQTAHELEEHLLQLANQQQDTVWRLWAYHSLGVASLLRGEIAPARMHFEHGTALYVPQEHGTLAFRYGHDPGVLCLAYAGLALWLLGYPEQAVQRGREALTLAQDLSHPYSLGVALILLTMVHQWRQEGQVTHEQADATVVLAIEQEFALILAFGTIMRGRALAAQGQGAEGIVHIRQGLASTQTIGAEIFWPYFLVLLAQAYGQVAQPEAGLTVLAEALALVDKTGERWCEAELHRLKGELLLAQSPDNHTEAETCVQKALDVACHQQAKSLELRAATSMARLWQQQGKRDEARQLLAEVYDWFTEGFDTLDLKEAKALLDELAESW
jgi:predicted ATPase